MTLLFILSFIFTLGYMITWVKFQQYQFLERDYTIVANNKQYSKLWHVWKGANQGVFFILLGSLFGWKLMIINSILYWVLFDGFLNIFVLNREFFYIGNTSWIDRSLRSITGLINKLLGYHNTRLALSASFIAFIIKVGLLAGALYIYYI